MISGCALVTGGAGFIGSQLVKIMLNKCSHVYVIDNLSTGKREALPDSPNLTFIEGSITDRHLVRVIMPKVEYIFHFACSNLLKSVDDPEGDLDNNLDGGFILLQGARFHCPNLRRFVYASTTSIYSNAANFPTAENYYQIRLPYAASKFSVEHYCDVYHHLYRVPTVVLRFSNVFGPGQLPSNPYCGVVAKFFAAARQQKPLTIFGDGRQTRDFTFIEDALQAVLLAAARTEAIGQIYNVGTGLETTVIKLAEHITRISGFTEGTVQFKPKRVVDLVERRSIDASKLIKELQWKIKYSLNRGLLKTYQWLEERPDESISWNH